MTGDAEIVMRNVHHRTLTGYGLRLAMAVAFVVAFAGCGAAPEPYVRKSAANGGPEDPTILAIEKLGGHCYRLSVQRGLGGDDDRFWIQHVEGDPVIGVDIEDCFDRHRLFDLLAQLPHLQRLGLHRMALRDDHAQAFPSLKTLRCLRLVDTRITHVGCRELAQLDRLQNLHLSGNDLDDRGANEIARLKELEVLSIQSDQIQDEGAKRIASLSKLRTLDLSSKKITDKGIAELALLPDLTSLSLRKAKVTGNGLRRLATMRKLESLDLSSTSVASRDLTDLTPLIGLKTLTLRYAKSIDDAGLESLAGMPQLRELDLSGTRVTDMGMRALAKSPSLSDLSICGTAVTADGLMELVRLRSLRSVQATSSQVSWFGASRFERAHGKCYCVIDR